MYILCGNVSGLKLFVLRLHLPWLSVVIPLADLLCCIMNTQLGLYERESGPVAPPINESGDMRHLNCPHMRYCDGSEAHGLMQTEPNRNILIQEYQNILFQSKMVKTECFNIAELKVLIFSFFMKSKLSVESRHFSWKISFCQKPYFLSKKIYFFYGKFWPVLPIRL